jgi:hypothetical protein
MFEREPEDLFQREIRVAGPQSPLTQGARRKTTLAESITTGFRRAAADTFVNAGRLVAIYLPGTPVSSGRRAPLAPVKPPTRLTWPAGQMRRLGTTSPGTSNVTCPFSNSGMLGMMEFYGIPAATLMGFEGRKSSRDRRRELSCFAGLN